MIKIKYCYNNGKVGEEGLPYLCIFRNRVNGSFYLGLASVVWNGAKHVWQSFDDVPSYPYAYFELDKKKLTAESFVMALAKELEVSLDTLFPEGPKQLELPL